LPGSSGDATETDRPVTLNLRASERNNTVIEFDKSYLLKTFRRLEDGINPEQEMAQFLSTRPDYHGTAPLLGCIEYRRQSGEASTLAVLYQYVANQGDAWQYTLDQLSSFFERVAAQPPDKFPNPKSQIPKKTPGLGFGIWDLGIYPEEWPELVAGFPEIARLLGQRTADLHRALADHSGNAAFAPEPMTRLYQRSFYQSLRTLTGRLCERLKRSRNTLSEAVRPLARVLVTQRDTLLLRCRELLSTGQGGQRIRCHGEYHLGELLFTGKDFVIIDFEGDISRTISERRLKRSPLRDVAGLIRSFDYAVHSVLLGLATSRGQPHGVIRPEDRPRLEPWGHAWFNQVSREMVQAYLQAIASADLLPSSAEAQGSLLELFLLEKTLLEVDAELTYRPEWAVIPLHAVLRLLGVEDTEK
jgi:maltose alpha-D-glucosyltransferase / alpha-amylase